MIAEFGHPGFVETEFLEQYTGSKDLAQQAYSRYKVLEAADISRQVLFVLEQPPHVQIHDILMRPTDQPS